MSELRTILGDQVDALARGAGADYLRTAKKHVTNRKAIVVVFAYALRGALDELSPDERAVWLQLALSEVQRR
jgi:hypothetical protein